MVEIEAAATIASVAGVGMVLAAVEPALGLPMVAAAPLLAAGVAATARLAPTPDRVVR